MEIVCHLLCMGHVCSSLQPTMGILPNSATYRTQRVLDDLSQPYWVRWALRLWSLVMTCEKAPSCFASHTVPTRILRVCRRTMCLQKLDLSMLNQSICNVWHTRGWLPPLPHAAMCDGLRVLVDIGRVHADCSKSLLLSLVGRSCKVRHWPLQCPRP